MASVLMESHIHYNVGGIAACTGPQKIHARMLWRISMLPHAAVLHLFPPTFSCYTDAVLSYR